MVFKFFKKIFFWFDNAFLEEKYALITSGKEIDWMRVIPFIILHLSCFMIFFGFEAGIGEDVGVFG